jgi:hypothetical protein
MEEASTGPELVGMRPRSILAGSLVVAFLVAGCLAPVEPSLGEGDDQVPGIKFPAVVPPVPDYDFRKVVDPDHVGHQVPHLHTAGHGLELVGHSRVAGILPPGMRGSITQIDVWNGWAVVAGMEHGPAFIIVDIRSPMEPRAVSWAPTMADGWTARFSKDGQYVFYGCQVLPPPYAPSGAIKGDCTDPDRIHGQTSVPGGVSVWDVSDKTKPTFVTFTPTAAAHNLYVQEIDGVDYAFTNGVEILKFDRDEKKLQKVAQVPGRHDVTVQKHPVTGDWLLYTGTRELAIYNVNDPANPEVILEGFADGVGWHDQVQFPFLVDGRALLALAGETFASPQGVPDAVTIVDITDPASPVKLSSWKAPFMSQIPWASYTFSVHEMAATPQGQLAVSWYHGGVWVIDLSTKERQEKPVVLGAYQPSMPINAVPSTFVQTAVPLVPFVWSAAWDQRGYLVVPDMHTGLYVLKPSWGLHEMLDAGA